MKKGEIRLAMLPLKTACFLRRCEILGDHSKACGGNLSTLNCKIFIDIEWIFFGRFTELCEFILIYYS